MTTWYNWRVWCTDDSKYETVLSETEPTYCPTNPVSHTIDQSKTTWTEKRNKHLMKIDEGLESLGGYYKSKGERIDVSGTHTVAGDIVSAVAVNDTVINVDQATIDALDLDHIVQINNGVTTAVLGRIIVVDDTNNQITVNGTGSSATFSTGSIEILTTYKDFVQVKNIGVFSFSYISTADHDGDGLEVQVYPNLVIGAITANVSPADTVINVTQDVIDNIKVGFLCRLDNGVVRECFGEVTAVDDVNNQITVQKPAINSFLAAAPTYVKMFVQMLYTDDIGPAGRHTDGLDKIGGSLLLKNKAVRVCYTNYTNTSKKFCFNVGHSY